MKLKSTLMIFSAALAALGCPCAFATAELGTGSIPAQFLASGITSVRSLMAESKRKKPSPGSDTRSTVLSDSSSDLRDSLSSRLETVAGVDKLIAVSDVYKQISLFAEARYRLTRVLQIGGSASVRIQGNDTAKDAAAQALLGPTFNIGTAEGIRNAFFVSTKAGVTFARETVDGTLIRSGIKPTISLSGGKRFQLTRNMAYAPSIGVVKQAGYEPVFAFVPVAVSFFF